jgi:hypothetical protein
MRRSLVGGLVCANLVGLVAVASAQEGKDVKVGPSSATRRAAGASLWLHAGAQVRLQSRREGRGVGALHRHDHEVRRGRRLPAARRAAVGRGLDHPEARAGALAGTYVGATAEAGWAVGLGSNVLVGGSKKGVALQPISIEGFSGANVAAGVVEVELKPAK